MFGKTLTGRTVLFTLLLALLAGVGIYYFWGLGTSFPVEYTLALLLLLVVLFGLMVYYNIQRPLKKILKQIKLLITGKPSKKILTKRKDEIGVIADFYNSITENIHKISGKLKEEKRMSSELDVASNIQKQIMPSESPEIPNLQIVAKTRSAAEIGGDSFDFIQRPDSTYIYIGDVTGHGAPAALVMMMVNTLLNTYAEVYDSTFDIVYNTNRILKPRIKSDMFMTMTMLRWDHKVENLSYVGCGHEYILIYRADQGKVDSVAAGGVALGMVPDNKKLIKEKNLLLKDGDVVLLYTDGITEAKNSKNEMFELEKLKEAFAKYAVQYSPEGIAHHISTDFSEYVQGTEQEDDVTLIVLKYSKNKDQKETTEKSTKW